MSAYTWSVVEFTQVWEEQLRQREEESLAMAKELTERSAEVDADMDTLKGLKAQEAELERAEYELERAKGALVRREEAVAVREKELLRLEETGRLYAAALNTRKEDLDAAAKGQREVSTGRPWSEPDEPGKREVGLEDKAEKVLSRLGRTVDSMFQEDRSKGSPEAAKGFKALGRPYGGGLTPSPAPAQALLSKAGSPLGALQKRLTEGDASPAGSPFGALLKANRRSLAASLPSEPQRDPGASLSPRRDPSPPQLMLSQSGNVMYRVAPTARDSPVKGTPKAPQGRGWRGLFSRALPEVSREWDAVCGHRGFASAAVFTPSVAQVSSEDEDDSPMQRRDQQQPTLFSTRKGPRTGEEVPGGRESASVEKKKRWPVPLLVLPL